MPPGFWAGICQVARAPAQIIGRRRARIDGDGGAGDRVPTSSGRRAGPTPQRRIVVGQRRVGQHHLDAGGQLVGVARLEQEPGAGAVDQLGEPAGAGDDERSATGQGLQGDDPERLVERGDGDATRPVDGVPQALVGEEAGKVHEVADPFDLDLRLQLRQVAAASADDALDTGHTGTQQAHRPGQHLEPLLVLDPTPREDERCPLAPHRHPSTTTSGRCRWG